MALPDKMILTPQATVTVAEGEAADASSEFWQRVAGNSFIVYEGVPYDLGRNVVQSADPDTTIKVQLSAYPKRIVSLAQSGTTYAPGGVHFDGETFLSLAALSATNSPVLTYSYWFRAALGQPPAGPWIVDAASDAFLSDTFGSTNAPGFFAADEPFTGNRITFGGNDTSLAVWHNVIVCVDVNHADGARPHSIWVDDINVTEDDPLHSGGVAFTLTPNGFSFTIMSDTFGNFVTCDFADFWWGLGQYIDLTLTSNRRKFINSSGKPVDLGADGSTPTGTAPTFFLHRDAAAAASTFANDLSGHGNNFTITGTLTAVTGPAG